MMDEAEFHEQHVIRGTKIDNIFKISNSSNVYSILFNWYPTVISALLLSMILLDILIEHISNSVADGIWSCDRTGIAGWPWARWPTSICISQLYHDLFWYAKRVLLAELIGRRRRRRRKPCEPNGELICHRKQLISISSKLCMAVINRMGVACYRKIIIGRGLWSGECWSGTTGWLVKGGAALPSFIVYLQSYIEMGEFPLETGMRSWRWTGSFWLTWRVWGWRCLVMCRVGRSAAVADDRTKAAGIRVLLFLFWIVFGVTKIPPPPLPPENGEKKVNVCAKPHREWCRWRRRRRQR